MRITTRDELVIFLEGFTLKPRHFERLDDIAFRLKKSLEDHFSLTFTLRFDGQDRSDYAQLSIPADLLKPPLPEWPPEIRLSETTPLASIADAYLAKDESLAEIASVLEACGFVFVEPSLFVCGHDGNDAELDRLWRSLFDYD